MINEINTLSRQSGIPLYYQLKEILRHLIHESILGEGEILPPENELALQYGVSRQVARRALAELALEGLIVSRKGVGSFVNKRRITKQVDILAGFTRNLRAISSNATISVLKVAKITAPIKIQSLLNLKIDSEVVFIERLGCLDDGEPFAVIDAYYPQEVGSVLLDMDIHDRSIYSLLAEYKNIVPFRGDKTLSVVPATFEMAAKFNVREAFPLICHYGTTYTDASNPFEYSAIYYRSDRVAFAMTSFRKPEPDGGMIISNE